MESMLGFTNDAPVDDIFSDVFDIVIVWFGVSASAGTGKVHVFRTSTEAGREPKTVSISRRLPRGNDFDVLVFASSSSAKSSRCRRCCSEDDDDDDDATVVVVCGPFLRAAVLAFLSL